MISFHLTTVLGLEARATRTCIVEVNESRTNRSKRDQAETRRKFARFFSGVPFDGVDWFLHNIRHPQAAVLTCTHLSTTCERPIARFT